MPVVDGHMVSVRVNLKNKGTLEEVVEAMRSFPSLDLHSAPDHFIEVTDEPSRPQTRLDRDNGNGMAITVGRVFPDNVFDYRFVALSHNTVRGAAGCAILNAELLMRRESFSRVANIDHPSLAGGFCMRLASLRAKK